MGTISLNKWYLQESNSMPTTCAMSLHQFLLTHIYVTDMRRYCNHEKIQS
jgi:hypothetical protein